MKLKSILTLALVAIMTYAGSAFAIEAANVTASADLNGANFQHTPPTAALFNFADTIGATVGASGTGFTGGMPGQVAFAAGQYTAGVGPTSGYVLNAALFGMCAGATNTTATCSKFIPTGLAYSFANNAAYLGATGGDGTQLWSTVPVGTANFNQGTFETALVSGMGGPLVGTDTTLVFSDLSAKTLHHSAPAGTADGDYIDQRLAQLIGSATQGQSLRQAVIAQAGSGGNVTPNTTVGAIDATWLGNPENGCLTAAAALVSCMNTGVVSQAVGDNMAGAFAANALGGPMDVGSYGQLFNSSDTAGANTIAPVGVNQASTTYNPLSATFVGAAGPTLP